MAYRLFTITVSDSRDSTTDRSGPALQEELAEFEHVRHVIVEDDRVRISKLVQAVVLQREADVVVLCGGTGIAHRDVTIEAITPLFDKTLDGFGEAFRRLSWDEIGVRSVLSRACAGVYGGVLVVALPGSPNAVRLAARALLVPMLPHALRLLADDTKHDEI